MKGVEGVFKCGGEGPSFRVVEEYRFYVGSEESNLVLGANSLDRHILFDASMKHKQSSHAFYDYNEGEFLYIN